jgi:glycosyltransferase involved in cell wall biosynthesis
MTSPLLTIMLPTTIDRRKTFYPLLEEIKKQITKNKYEDIVEVIIDEDNKEKSIGKKRQDLLEKARGKYVVGIDSDDWIAEDYLDCIITSLKENPSIDHVGFLEDCDIDGDKSISIFSIRNKFWAENQDGYDHIRCANPKSVILREKALQVGYEDSRYGEDRVFSEAVTSLLTSEVFIEKPLYLYRYKSTPHNERYGIK